MRSYGRLHGLVFTILRYFNVYGPAQDYRRVIPPVISAFALKMLRGEQPVIYGDGAKRRDFVYVDDVNRFHLQCLTDARTAGGTFDLGTGRNHSVNQVVDVIRRCLGSGVRPRYAPAQAGEAEATLAEIGPAAALGWRARIGLEAGVARSLEDLQARLGTTKVETSG